VGVLLLLELVGQRKLMAREKNKLWSEFEGTVSGVPQTWKVVRPGFGFPGFKAEGVGLRVEVCRI